MPRNREYELRFTIAPEDAERLVSHRLVRDGLPRLQVGRLVSTYFDTPDLLLHRHRFGLRVRRAESETTHTLKRTGGSLVERGEWERTLDALQPDVGWLRETPLAPLVDDDAFAASLMPRFSVDVTRTSFPLRHGKATIEVAVDQGTIAADGVALPLSEVEFEIKRGRPDDVLDLVRTLASDLPLVLSLASKSERGYGLSDLTWGRPTESITPALERRMTLAQAFEMIVQTCLHVFLKNAALIEGDSDGEALHKARIALRHLRAACQLFRPTLRRKRFAVLRTDIKWLSDRLGAARDADVFQAAFFDPAARDGEVPGAQALAALMRDHRSRAHERLRAALESPRARLLFVELLAFASDGIRRSMRRDRCRPFVRQALDQQRRALAQRAADLARRPIEELHEVRKAAKMLRYDLDLLVGMPKIGSSGKARRLGKHLKTLQKSLGVLNDEDAMRTHLHAKVLSRSSADGIASGKGRRVLLAAAQLSARRVPADGPLREAEKAARRL